MQDAPTAQVWPAWVGGPYSRIAVLPFSLWEGGRKIRNDMTTAWHRQASWNVIPTEGPTGPSGGI